MNSNHWAVIIGALAGYFLISRSSCLGANSLTQNTIGMVYNQAVSIAAPAPPA
jgi:hypothetical protein